MEHIQGLVSAVHTPFKSDGGLNLSRVADQAALLAGNGVSHVFVAGTTGEGMLLSSAERRELVEEWARCKGGLGLIVHVGHVSLVEARSLSAHAGGLDVDAIAAMAPPFFAPTGLQELVAWCAEVAAPAADKPFLFYHIPSLNMALDAVHYVERARDHIPTFRGVKYTHHDMMEAARLYDAYGDELDILAGRDEFHLPFLALGARGAVGSTYNYAGPHYIAMRDAWFAGDHDRARELNAHTARLVDLLRRAPEIAVGKAFVRHLGVDVGPTRLPIRNLEPEEEARLVEQAESLGILGRPLA